MRQVVAAEPKLVNQLRVAAELLQRAAAYQQTTITVLNALGTPSNEYTVDAGALDTVAHTPCENDTAHGPATCHFVVWDGLERVCADQCPQCTEDYIKKTLLAGDYLSVDVSL